MLETKKFELENKICEVKVLKDKTAEFKMLKADSTGKEEQLKKLNKESETYMEEKKKLVTNKENKDTEIKDINGQIQLLQNKKIAQINHGKWKTKKKKKSPENKLKI